MATYNRPGVYVEEVASNFPLAVSPSATVATFIGPLSRGPLVPTLVTSWSQFTTLYGNFTDNAGDLDMINAVNMFFSNGGSQCYIQRAVVTLPLVAGTSTPASTTLNVASVTSITSSDGSTAVTLTTGNSKGAIITGTGIPSGTTIVSISSTAITLSQAATVAAGTAITVSTVTYSSATLFGNATVAISTGANVSQSGTSTTYTSATHNLKVGQTVTISGVLASTATPTNVYQGTFVVTAVGSATTFTVVNPAAPATAVSITTAGTVTSQLTTPSGGELTFASKNPGVWGNNLYYEITNSTSNGNTYPGKYFNLAVYYGGTTAGYIVERFSDLTLLATDPQYVLTIINASSNYITAIDPNAANHGASSWSTANTPLSITATALAGGLDGTVTVNSTAIAATTSTSKLDVITQPILLNAPGVIDATNVNLLLTYAYNRGDVFVIIDPTQTTLDAASQIALANTYTGGSAGANALGYGAVYYPNLTIPTPTSSTPGATTLVYPGGAVAAKYVTTDASRGVFKSPAGLEARLSNVVSVPTLTNVELDSLNTGVTSLSTGVNATPVNAIRYIPGAGIVVMGARTLNTGYQYKYVSVRRSLIYIRKLLTDLTSFAMFESNDQRLWARLQNTCESALIGFWQSGGLKGSTAQDAFYVKSDSTINTPASISAGEVHLEIGVALQRPAEFVVIRISQYDSGSVVTVL
jgi:uncharacterized protein